MVYRYTNEVLKVAQTLEELKRENAEAEQAVNNEAPQAEELNAELEEAAEDVEEVLEDEAESNETESNESTVESWMQSEEQDSQDEQAVPVAAHAKMRSKLKAAISEKDSELQALKAEVEQLKSAPKSAPDVKSKPKREDFFESDDPDEAFFDAMTDWKLEQQALQQNSKAEQEAINRKNQEFLKKQNEAVEDHYVRAAKLASENGIEPEVYNSADLKVRQAVEAVYPENGDAMTETLISMIGDDSEKVMYYLGRNKNKLLEFQNTLQSDTTGIKAAMMIGELKSQLTKPFKKKSNAPAPPPELKGDQSTGKSRSYLRKYENAKTPQERFDVKQEAKKAGVKTREW